MRSTLEDAVVNVAGEALGRLEDARLAWGNGRCDFAVNRRANREADVPKLRRAAGPAGARRPRRPGPPRRPARRLPAGGRLRLRLPLHGARLLQVLRRLRGVRPGRARERDIPARRPCSSPAAARDQNPIPRRSLELAERYGKQLADERRDGPRRPDAADRRAIAHGVRGDPAGLRQPAHPRADRGRRAGRPTSTSPAGPGICSRRSKLAASSSRPIPIRSRSGGSTA